MTPQELGQLIELIISDILTLEEAAAIHFVSADALQEMIDEVMTFRRDYSPFNEVVVRISDFNRLENETR